MAKRQKIPKHIRAAVYRRDQWTCQRCGRVIKPQTDQERDGSRAPLVPNSDPHAPYVWLELDHSHPVKLGGSDDYSNLRAACTPCNKAKSSGTAEVEWAVRAAMAEVILSEGEPTKRTVERAAEVLTGAKVMLPDRGR